ncbi:RHS repeat protein [Elizabethkingia anophelis]|nr:RHS repeat protein [Elizabethkingia anophelis]
MKKLYIILTILSVSYYKSQTNSKYIIQNGVRSTNVFPPNINSLFKYNEIPVSLYSGIPNIEIPIYSIKEGDIELPISIKYHAGGIKVSEEASPVGLGWSINSGGNISQIMAGSNDFSSVGLYNSKFFQQGYNNINTRSPVLSGCSSGQPNSYYSDDFYESPTLGHMRVDLDYQPDKFLISLPNESITAYLDMEKTTLSDYPKFLTVGQQNVDIKLIPRSGSFAPDSNGNYDFKITNSHGIKYFFEGDKLTSTPLIGTFITGLTKQLTHIEDTKGNKVSFKYSPSTFTNRFSGCRNTIIDSEYSHTEGGFLTCNRLTSDENFLEEIEFTDGKIQFIWTAREDMINSKKISSIKIFNKSKLIKQFDFNYDYFISNFNMNTPPQLLNFLDSPNNNKILTHRLKLLNIIERLNNEKYDFEYNTEYNLPHKLSLSTDFWGYFNGQENSTLIPDPNKYLLGTAINPTFFKKDDLGYFYTPSWSNKQSNNEIVIDEPTKHYLADRRSSLNTLAGTLTKINYPTVGSTEFQYELNTFSNYNLQSLIEKNSTQNYSSGAGLRIKSIISKDNNNSIPLVKKYTYEEFISNGSGQVSNGKLAELPKFFEINNRCYLYKNYGDNPMVFPNFDCGSQTGDFKSVKVSVYEATQNQGVSTLPQGTYVGYSKVTEETSGKGKTDYYFENYNNVMPCINLMSRGEQNFPENGNLKSKKIYNNIGELINETTYTYKSNYNDKLNTYFLNGAILEHAKKYFSESDGSGGIPVYAGIVHYYPINLYKSLLDQTITKEYFSSTVINPIENKEIKSYNNKYLLSKQTNIVSNENTSIETTYQYAQEKGNQKLMNANMIGIPLQTTTTKDGKVIANVETKYDDPTNLLPTSILSYDLQNPAVGKTELTYDLYDNKGNILQYSDKKMNPNTIIWGYNQTQPIAKIEGITYAELANKLGFSNTNVGYLSLDIVSKSNNDIDTSTEQSLITALDAFKNNAALSNYQIVTYTYDPLIGVTSITPPSGIREIYKYDSANRLESVKDVNGSLLKEYQYQYSTVFYNTEKSQPFTRNNCPSGTTSGTYNYIVPANKYSSIISKADAEQQAQNEINTNGQIFANSNATCSPIVTYYNTTKSQIFTRNNCLPNTIPGTYTYTIPANTYSSTLSQADADQKAENDININGQNLANVNAICDYSRCTVTSSHITPIYYSSFEERSPEHISATLNFSISDLGNIGNSWSNGVMIGTLGNSCIPKNAKSFNVTSGNKNWNISINQGGNISIRLNSGSVYTGDMISLNFEYDKN